MKKGQEPAFPRSGMESKLGTYVPPVEGMSLRQYYAAKAMQGTISNDKYHSAIIQIQKLEDLSAQDKERVTREYIMLNAKRCFQMADAMITFEEEEGNNETS